MVLAHHFVASLQDGEGRALCQILVALLVTPSVPVPLLLIMQYKSLKSVGQQHHWNIRYYSLLVLVIIHFCWVINLWKKKQFQTALYVKLRSALSVLWNKGNTQAVLNWTWQIRQPQDLPIPDSLEKCLINPRINQHHNNKKATWPGRLQLHLLQELRHIFCMLWLFPQSWNLCSSAMRNKGRWRKKQRVHFVLQVQSE